MIATQRQREPTAENMSLLGDMASFQSSFITMVSGLRGYVTTGRDSFKFEYTSNLGANDGAWEDLNEHAAQLDSRQTTRLEAIAAAREGFLLLPDRMFDAVEGEHSREDLHLFRTEAVPAARTMLQLLDDVTGSQQQLLQADLSDGSDNLARARWQTFAGGIGALLAAVALAVVLRWQIVGPIGRLTGVAEQIRAGNLSARAPVESRDEIGSWPRHSTA